MMKKFRNTLVLTCLSFFTSNNLFAGPTVALIAADKSSHVCKVGTYLGTNLLSGTSTFNKLVDFKTTNFQNDNAVDFKSNFFDSFDFGLHFGYTRFFDRKYGWNVFDVKGGYSKFAKFFNIEKNEDNKENKNTMEYSGLSIDILTGFAYNFKENGLDFEEGNQYGDRIVVNINGGINLNLRSFEIQGEAAFKSKYLDAIFADSSQLVRAILEPSVEIVYKNGFLLKAGLNMGYFGPWKAEKSLEENFLMEENKFKKLPDTFSLAPMVELGWDFSALIN